MVVFNGYLVVFEVLTKLLKFFADPLFVNLEEANLLRVLVVHLTLHLDELCTSVESFFFDVESVDLFLQMLVLKLCLLVQLRMFGVLLSESSLFSLELTRLGVYFLQLGAQISLS